MIDNESTYIKCKVKSITNKKYAQEIENWFSIGLVPSIALVDQLLKHTHTHTLKTWEKMAITEHGLSLYIRLTHFLNGRPKT